MFTTHDNECVGFESKWKVKKVCAQGTTQTTEYFLKEIHTNTATTAEIETQTDEVAGNISEVDMQKLGEWLNKIYPSVKREIDEANNSQAFRNYYPFTKDGSEIHSKLLQTLKVNSDESSKMVLPISALSWNSTGRTLAISCSHSHKSWCYHTGMICFYSFDRNDKLPETASKKLTTEACITVLRFHPSLPNIIAGGTYSGEILIWNSQHDESNSVVVKVTGHEERLTQISWINDVDPAKTILLATSSLDGFLNLWNFNSAAGTLTIKERYNIKPPVLSRIERKTETPEELLNKVARGVICFDFSTYVPDMFIVGVEGGLIVQCSMLGTSPLKGSTKEMPLSDPVYKYYQPHEGEVISVSFSPNRKEMFMTNGSEGEIHIYLIDQDEPAQVIFLEKPLNVVLWVPYEEKIICGCGALGSIEIFNLISGRLMKNVVKENIEHTVLMQMDLNKKRPTTVAVGNNKGHLQIWNVPWGSFSSSI